MISDIKLTSDLDNITKEIKRRKKLIPFVPFATWAMIERFAAMSRYQQREKKLMLKHKLMRDKT